METYKPVEVELVALPTSMTTFDPSGTYNVLRLVTVAELRADFAPYCNIKSVCKIYLRIESKSHVNLWVKNGTDCSDSGNLRLISITSDSWVMTT